MVTAPITVLCSRNITPRHFIQRLAKEVHIERRWTIPDLEEAVAGQLRRYPRPLFIDQANFLHERSLGTVCHLWELARIPIVLVGTKALYELFTKSKLTEEVRDQLSSRVALHYLLSELSLKEAKAIIQQAMGEEATDEAVAQIYTLTGGVHRHVDMIIPRIFHLMELNRKALCRGWI
jgi:DNA transposition AAA+ family ATPase